MRAISDRAPRADSIIIRAFWLSPRMIRAGDAGIIDVALAGDQIAMPA